MTIVVCSVINFVTGKVKSRLDYRKVEFEKIKGKIDSVNWRREFRDTDIEEAWKLFRTVYEDTVKTCVPVRTVKVSNRPPWLTAHVKRSLRDKYRAWAIYKRIKNPRLSQVQKIKEPK